MCECMCVYVCVRKSLPYVLSFENLVLRNLMLKILSFTKCQAFSNAIISWNILITTSKNNLTFLIEYTENLFSDLMELVIQNDQGSNV